MSPIEQDINKLAKLNVNKYVRKISGACEENVKIKRKPSFSSYEDQGE